MCNANSCHSLFALKCLTLPIDLTEQSVVFSATPVLPVTIVFTLSSEQGKKSQRLQFNGARTRIGSDSPASPDPSHMQRRLMLRRKGYLWLRARFHDAEGEGTEGIPFVLGTNNPPSGLSDVNTRPGTSHYTCPSHIHAYLLSLLSSDYNLPSPINACLLSAQIYLISCPHTSI